MQYVSPLIELLVSVFVRRWSDIPHRKTNGSGRIEKNIGITRN